MEQSNLYKHDIARPLNPAVSVTGDAAASEPNVRFARIRGGRDFWLAFAAALPTGTHAESTRDWLPSVVRFCDFASAGGTWDDASAYRVWLPVLKFDKVRRTDVPKP